jgi:hypothetical protein
MSGTLPLPPVWGSAVGGLSSEYRGVQRFLTMSTVVDLERISLDLPFLLAEGRGQLVSREESVERIWGKGVFPDSDASIDAAVREIRRARRQDPWPQRTHVPCRRQQSSDPGRIRAAGRHREALFAGELDAPPTVSHLEHLERALAAGGLCLFAQA